MSRQDDLNAVGLDVSRETIEALNHFGARLRHWSTRINLVSNADDESIWRRHVLDSAQLFRLGNRDGALWCDLGSGGGLPGIVLSILSRELTPGQKFVLIESDRRKGAFLRVIAQELDLNCRVMVHRIEEAEPQHADTLSARALAPLDKLLAFAMRHLAPDGIALFPKGRNAASEVEYARLRWNFDLDIIPSMTEAGASILRLSSVARKSESP